MSGIARQELKTLVTEISGASSVGITPVLRVSADAREMYDSWISDGCHAGMSYLERYTDVRNNPVLLLDGAKSLIMAAFSYANPEAIRLMNRAKHPLIAEYALGKDYHIEVRNRLILAGNKLCENFGGQYRVCVDTAPLRERYWAQQAGLGFIGLNNYLIIPGQGAHFYLGAILWTGEITDEYDRPCNDNCGFCGKCIEACPMGALSPQGRLDARQCLSYLTIESRDPLPENTNLGGRIFGCDTCRRVCPHEPENPPQTPLNEFIARPDVTNLSACDWRGMTSEQFNRLFRNSAVKRAKLDKLKSFL